MKDWIIPAEVQKDRDRERLRMLQQERAQLAQMGETNSGLESEISRATGGGIRADQVQWDAAPAIDANKVQWDQPAKRTVLTPEQSRKVIMDKEAAKVPHPAVDGMGPLDLAAAGFGRRFSNTGMGIQQRLGKVTEDEVADRRRLDQPLLDTPAGAVGDFLGSAAQVLPFAAARGANTLLGSGILGGLFGAVQPTVKGEDWKENAGKGAGFGVAGQAGANLLGRIVQPVRGAGLNPEETRLAAEAARRGINLTPGQLTKSKPIQALESTMLDMPFTAGPQQAVRQAQGQAWNRNLAQTFGSTADDLTPEVMGEAKRRVGGTIGDIANRNAMNVDDPFINRLADMQGRFVREQTDGVNRIASNYIDDFMGKVRPDGTVDGKAYRTLDSAIGKRIRDTADGDLKNTLRDLRGLLREGMDNSITPADREAWNTARRQYANMKTIDKALKNDASGEVFPNKLAQSVRKSDEDAFIYGRPGNELVDLSKIGTAFIRDGVPNSGTAQRQYWRDFLNGSLLTQGVKLGQGAAGGTLGRGAQAFMNSDLGRAYLTQGLLGGNTGRAMEIGAGLRPALNPFLIPAGLLSN